MTGAQWVVVGLGNPGPEYAATRHNVGFQVVDRLAATLGAGPWEDRWHGAVTVGRRAGHPVLLVKPMTYMNNSGQAVAAVLAATGVAPPGLVVVHDDLDLPCGRVKVAVDRGAGGHNGVASIIEGLGRRDFCRVRLGIGRPAPGVAVVDHVLSPPSAEEAVLLRDGVAVAGDAVLAILDHGVTAAMNDYNRTPPAP